MSDTSAEQLPWSTRLIYSSFDWVRERRRPLLLSLVVLAVLAVLASGFYVVKKEEQAVVTRFGKVVNMKVSPGLHYVFPLIEQAHVRKVMRVTRQNVATQDADGNVYFSILSGDTNLFEVDVALQYRIGNLRNYLYATSDPHAVLALVVRERLVGNMSNSFIDLIFTNSRDIIQRRLFDETQAFLDANDIGVELLALNIVGLRPIDETVAAFRDVSDAIAESIETVSEANRRAEQLLARSRGQAEAVVLNSRARARERRLQAASSAQAYLDLLDAYRSEPSSVSTTRYWQRMREVFRDATLAKVNPDDTSTIDINMIESFMPGVGRLPEVTAMAPEPAGSLIGAASSITLASERGAHGIEAVQSDRYLLDGRFHSPRSERHHLGTAELRSLIFDDLSIFSHRHVAPTSVWTAVEQSEQPMVETTIIDTSEDAQKGRETSMATTTEPSEGQHAPAEEKQDGGDH